MSFGDPTGAAGAAIPSTFAATPNVAPAAGIGGGGDVSGVQAQLQQNFLQQQALSAIQQEFALKQNILKVITENAIALAEALGEAGAGVAKNTKADAQAAARLFGQ